MGENTYDIILAGRYMAGKEEVFKIVSGSNAAETVSRSKQSGLIKNWDVTMKQMYTTQGGGVVVKLWNCFGMDKHGLRNVTPNYFHSILGVILVFDIGEEISLTELKEWIARAGELCTKDVENIVFSLWINDNKNAASPIPDKVIEHFYHKHKIPQELVVRIATETEDNIQESYQKVVDAIHLMHVDPRRAPRYIAQGRQQQHKKCSC